MFPFPCPPSEDTEKQVGRAARLGGIFVKEQPGDESGKRNPPAVASWVCPVSSCPCRPGSARLNSPASS